MISENPGRLDPYLYLAGLYDSIGKPAEGLKVLTGIEGRFPAEAAVQFRIGVLFDKLGQKEESIMRMKRVVEINPDDAQALNYLGYTYAEMGTNLDEALILLKKANALRPDDGFILDSLGWVYFKLKRYDEAIKSLERAYEIVDDDTTIISHLAESYAAKNDFKSAIGLFRQVLELDPENRDAAEKIKKLKSESGER